MWLQQHKQGEKFFHLKKFESIKIFKKCGSQTSHFVNHIIMSAVRSEVWVSK